MGSASIDFLGYAFLVALASNLSRSIVWRQFVLLIGSIGFLGFFSHSVAAFLPLAAFLAFGFASLRMVGAGKTRAFVPLLILGILGFAWLKKYAFIPPTLFLRHPYLALGLSYIFFRVLHLIIDARNQELSRKVSIVSYINYTLNFTTLVSGPIQRYQDFAAAQLAPVPLPMDIFIAGEALRRIVVGFFKVNVLSLGLSMIQNSAVIALGTASSANQRVLNGITIGAVYPLYLYCNFSGYIDIVIGIARFLRIELPENFDRPFSSDNFIVFWSRWHITLSTWLKTYVYNPLLIATMRRWPSAAVEPFLGVFAYFVTFFLVGVWHGQTSVFLCFGFLQGLGVSATKLYQVLMTRKLGRKEYKELSRSWLYNVAARGLTYTWFAFTLLWFWSNWTKLGEMARALRAPEMALVWLAIFVGASVILEFWEIIRERVLSVRIGGEKVFDSRYSHTVLCTACVVASIAVGVLLNAPAPDIVYKAF